MVGNCNREYSRADVARIFKAQTYQGRYCPRSWIQIAIHEGLTPDDICLIVAEDCRILGAAYDDMEVPFAIRTIYRAEQYERRYYRLPAAGCPYIEREEDRPPPPPKFGDDDGEEATGHCIGFYDLLRNNTGNTVNIFKHLERVGRSLAIKEQSRIMADRLEAVGIPAYRASAGVFHKVGLLTNLDEELSRQFANLMLIPSVAVQSRSHLRNDLSFWIDNVCEHSKHLRYMVVTCGENVPVFGPLKRDHERWTAKVSKAFKVLNERYGATIYYRHTEFTRNAEDRSVNMHMNILYHVPYLEGDGWRCFLDDVRELVDCAIDEAGILRSPDEVVKYVTKPSDVLGMSDSELAWFASETKKARLFHAYGSLKEFRADLKRERLRVVFDRKSKRLRLMRKRVINDAELFTKRDEQEPVGAEQANHFERDVFAALLAERNIDRVISDGPSDLDMPEEENKIVGLMLPHSAFMNISEPCLMVRNYTRNPQTDIGVKALEFIGELSKRLAGQVMEKLEDLPCKAFALRDYDSIRRSFEAGNRDAGAVYSSLLYRLDTLHDNSFSHPYRDPAPPPLRPPRLGQRDYEAGLRAPVSA